MAAYLTIWRNAGFIAAPVPVLGWLMIWGDGPGRIEFVETMTFTVIFGLVFYGLLGAAAAWALGKMNKGS